MDSIVLVAAVLPAIALCAYIYFKDRSEKEPLSLLLLLLGLGAATGPIAARIESLLSVLLNYAFSSTFAYNGSAGEYYFTSMGASVLYNAIDCFLCVALVEEGLKWLVLFFMTKRNRNFNSSFDAVIYAVFVSLGFAVLENVLYAFSFGLETALYRALTAVPAHMFFGVSMGKFYGDWNTDRLCGALEAKLAEKGVITTKNPPFGSGHLVRSLAIPVLLHGLYDFCLSVDSTLLYYVFLALLFALYVVSFSTVRKQSTNDIAVDRLVVRLVCKKYKESIPLILYTVNTPWESGVIVPKSGAEL